MQNKMEVNTTNTPANTCGGKCGCHKMVPIIIILIGLDILLGACGVMGDKTVTIIWSILLIIIGIKKMMKCKCCAK